MTERERLIELLSNIDYACDNESNLQDRIEFISDYLLANGVILSPVTVGDKVYVNPYTWGYLSFIDYEHCFIHSEHFVITEVVSIIKTRKQNIIKLKIYNKTTCSPKYKRYPISSIGITVFLTKEDAEKALKDKKKE